MNLYLSNRSHLQSTYSTYDGQIFYRVHTPFSLAPNCRFTTTINKAVPGDIPTRESEEEEPGAVRQEAKGGERRGLFRRATMAMAMAMCRPSSPGSFSRGFLKPRTSWGRLPPDDNNGDSNDDEGSRPRRPGGRAGSPGSASEYTSSSSSLFSTLGTTSTSTSTTTPSPHPSPPSSFRVVRSTRPRNSFSRASFTHSFRATPATPTTKPKKRGSEPALPSWKDKYLSSPSPSPSPCPEPGPSPPPRSGSAASVPNAIADATGTSVSTRRGVGYDAGKDRVVLKKQQPAARRAQSTSVLATRRRSGLRNVVGVGDGGGDGESGEEEGEGVHRESLLDSTEEEKVRDHVRLGSDLRVDRHKSAIAFPGRFDLTIHEEESDSDTNSDSSACYAREPYIKPDPCRCDLFDFDNPHNSTSPIAFSPTKTIGSTRPSHPSYTTPRFGHLAHLDFKLSGACRMRWGGREIETRAFFQKDGGRGVHGRNRAFRCAQDGREYVWVIGGAASELVTNDEERRVVAQFHPAQSSLFGWETIAGAYRAGKRRMTKKKERKRARMEEKFERYTRGRASSSAWGDVEAAHESLSVPAWDPATPKTQSKPKRSWWKGKAFLEIRQEGMHMVDDIVVTFVYIEKLRRDKEHGLFLNW